MTPDRAEPMKYAILGSAAGEARDKLAAYRGRVAWSYLRPHYRSGVLYFVDSSLELEEVGAAIGGDDRERVAAWLKAGDLVRIEALHAAQWEDGPAEFEALVVSPFVLCQPL